MMRLPGGSTCRAASICSVVSAVVAVVGICLTPAASARTVPTPDPGIAIFKVGASHGYEVRVFASRSPDRTGSIAVFASNARSAAIYRFPATVTGKIVRADLGSLGRISVKAVPADRKPAVLRSCDGEEKRKVAAVRYEGTIDFHGEEGFTDVEGTGGPFDYRTFQEFACAEEGGRPAGKSLPGARLDVHRLPESNELMLTATQLRPGAAAEVWVQIDEGPEGFETTRATEVRAGPAALRFDPQLRSATLSPPAPFAGHATYHRSAPPARRWTGNLTVDLPGDSDYPLTGPGLRVTLDHPTA
jgi:hypothetical protein